ncbi:cold-shock protein [Streptomyces sp. NBC_00005]|uniref:cold-shock protein n=1 Tax=Streptomyces sp. NBC_00005 TaxID=2903609 RepID=UPI00324F60A1
MTRATVREWHEEKDWGVLDSGETPGGCWAHFSAVEMPGFRTLAVGQDVAVEWEAAEQDGYRYRAVRVVPAD